MADDVKKAYVPPVFVMSGRVPGQVPTKKRMRTLGQVQALRKMGARSAQGAANLTLGNLAGKPKRTPVPLGGLDEMPGDLTEDRLLAQDAPMLKPSSVTSNLGLPPPDAQHWAKFLTKAAVQASNEVVFRKAVYEKLMEAGFSGPMRKAIFVRALSHFRTVQKGGLEVYTWEDDGELVKALFIGPRGGRWADPQHTVPYDPKKHGKKKIIVIDKTGTQSKPKQTPSNKTRQAQAKRPKKIIVIDKTEEKAEGGTADDTPIQKVPSTKDKESTKTKPQLLLFEPPSKPAVRERPELEPTKPSDPTQPEQALADEHAGKATVVDDTIEVGSVSVSAGIWGELEAFEVETLSNESPDGKHALVAAIEASKGRKLVLTEMTREYLIHALDQMYDIGKDKLEGGGEEAKRYRPMMPAIERLQKKVEALDVDAARARHLAARAKTREKFVALGIEPEASPDASEGQAGLTSTPIEPPAPDERPAAREAVQKDIDALIAEGERRMQAATDEMRGLRPAATDWMTEDELAKLHELQLQAVKLQETTEEIRERVKQKRAARRAKADMSKLSAESIMVYMGGLKPGTPMSAGDFAVGFPGQASKAAGILKKLVAAGKLEIVPPRPGYDKRVAEYRIPNRAKTRTKERLEEAAIRADLKADVEAKAAELKAQMTQAEVESEAGWERMPDGKPTPEKQRAAGMLEWMADGETVWPAQGPGYYSREGDTWEVRDKDGKPTGETLTHEQVAERMDMERFNKYRNIHSNRETIESADRKAKMEALIADMPGMKVETDGYKVRFMAPSSVSTKQAAQMVVEAKERARKAWERGELPGVILTHMKQRGRKVWAMQGEYGTYFGQSGGVVFRPAVEGDPEPGWERMPESEAKPEPDQAAAPESPKFTLHEPAPPVKMAGRLLAQLQELRVPDELANALAAGEVKRTTKVALGKTEQEQLKTVLEAQMKKMLRKMKSTNPNTRAEGRGNLANMARVMQQLDPDFKVPEPPKPKRKPGSRKKVAVEQGDHVWGSRKDKWEIRNPNDLDSLTPDEQVKVTTKARLFQVEDIDDLLQGGTTPAGVLVRRAVESMISPKPNGNSLEARKLYIEGLDFVARSLNACKTHKDVEEFMTEWRHLAQGKVKLGTVDLTPELKAQTEDQILSEMGKEPDTPWPERVRLQEAEDAAYEAYQEARRNLDPEDELRAAWEKARSDRMDANRAVSWKVNESQVLAKILGVEPDIIRGSSRQGGKVTVWAYDDSLEYGETNKYHRMAMALGTRMHKMINRYKRPKVWRDASYGARRLSERPMEMAEAELRDLLESKKRKGKRGPRQRFSWEREVPGEIRRIGGDPIPSPNPKKFSETFGFPNVQFGGWVSEDDAKAHLSGAHGGLLDLSDILGIDPKTISLNGRLSIGIGARGGGRFAAHYEPVGKIINITKIAGGGSLAHEWAHALDNILSVAHDPESTRAQMFMTGNAMTGVPQEVQSAVRDLMSTIRNSDFYKDAQALSPGADGYYARPHELFARAFEAWVEDTLVEQGRQSSYLVSGTRKVYATGKMVNKGRPGEREAQVYPQGDERKTIGAAMAKLMDAMRETEAIQKALRLTAFFGPAAVDLRPRFAIDEAALQKAKYTKRWKGPDGKWRYEYADKPKGRKKGPWSVQKEGAQLFVVNEDTGERKRVNLPPLIYPNPEKTARKHVAKLNREAVEAAKQAQADKKPKRKRQAKGVSREENLKKPVKAWPDKPRPEEVATRLDAVQTWDVVVVESGNRSITTEAPITEKTGFVRTPEGWTNTLDGSKWTTESLVAFMVNNIRVNPNFTRKQTKASPLGPGWAGQRKYEEQQKAKKSLQVFTADELLLQKAEARGGSYYKRVPTQKAGAKKKWRYFYKPEDYDKRDDAHTGGEDNQGRYLANSIAKCVKGAGGSCGPEAFSGLVKKYGAKRVAKTLRESVNGGTLAFKKGKFTAGKPRGEDEAATEQRKRSPGRDRGAGRRSGSAARAKRSSKARKERSGAKQADRS